MQSAESPTQRDINFAKRQRFDNINIPNFLKVFIISTLAMYNNFHKEFQINSRGHKYDYLSVMHYTKTAFGGGDVTIVTLDPAYQDKIGQRNGLSDGDVEQINGVFCK